MSHFSVLVIGDNVDEQLAPYIYEPEEIGENYNPKAKWDWYEVWGRWSGELIVKQGVKPEGIKFTPFNSDEFREIMIKENRANTALMKDIDMDKMKESVIKETEKIYDDIKNNAPYIIFNPNFISNTERDYVNNHTKEEFVEKYYPGIFNFSAIVKDWIWHENHSEHGDYEDWNKQVEKLISNLHPDTRLTVIDCHI